MSLEPTTRGLTAVEGLRVGHFTETRRPTGCTVILAPGGAVAGVDVRGASPGTRETELLSPLNAVETVHAILLSGGSAFGLDAAGGVMRWLDERGIGVELRRAGRRAAGQPIRVPIVPAAILFDLWVGDPTIRPDAAAGYAACEAATSEPPAQGNVGAGAGASIGKLFGIERAMKGGLGSAAVDGRRRHRRRPRRRQCARRHRRPGHRRGRRRRPHDRRRCPARLDAGDPRAASCPGRRRPAARPRSVSSRPTRD